MQLLRDFHAGRWPKFLNGEATERQRGRALLGCPAAIPAFPGEVLDMYTKKPSWTFQPNCEKNPQMSTASRQSSEITDQSFGLVCRVVADNQNYSSSVLFHLINITTNLVRYNLPSPPHFTREKTEAWQAIRSAHTANCDVAELAHGPRPA